MRLIASEEVHGQASAPLAERHPERLRAAVADAVMDHLIAVQQDAAATAPRATSRLADSFEADVTQTPRGLRGEVVAVGYHRWAEKGRRRGKMPPLAAIVEWVRVKGLPERAAYPIARKIGREGTKGHPHLRPAVDEHWRELVAELDRLL